MPSLSTQDVNIPMVQRALGSEHTLNLGLDIVNRVGRLHLEGDSLTREGFDKDLHVEDLNRRRVRGGSRHEREESH